MAFQKKASASSEVVLGSAVVEMKKMLTANESAVAVLKGLAEQAEELQVKIAAREDRIAALDTEWEETARAKKADFEISFRSHKQETVEKVLAEAGKISILEDVWKATQENLESYKQSFSEKVAAEVNTATRAIAANYENKSKLLEAEFKAKEAENAAKINSLEGQKTFLEEQVALWKKALDDERAASVERSKASSVGNITLGGPGYGK